MMNLNLVVLKTATSEITEFITEIRDHTVRHAGYSDGITLERV
jgi:hypothetical protein